MTKIVHKWLIVLVTLACCLFAGSGMVHAASSQVVYRVYNPNSGEHFYTESESEKNSLVKQGWQDENIAWAAPTSGQAVYRLYNANAGEHHYTTDVGEKAELMKLGWQDEGTSWYSGGNVAVYRVYNTGSFANNHHFTSDATEKQSLLTKGWKDEGVAWYGASKANAEKVIAVAKSQIGYHEGKSNYTKYGLWFKNYWPVKGYDFSHAEWCGMFVSWCGDQAGLSSDVYYKHSYTPAMVSAYQKRGQWQWPKNYQPKTGDIIFFDWVPGTGVDHVGLVEKNNNGIITTIEGNYKDQVKRRVISANNPLIFGYATPNY